MSFCARPGAQCAVSAIGLLSLFVSSACAPRSVEAVSPEPRPLWRELETSLDRTRAAGQQPVPAAALPAGPLTLRDALAFALLHSPDLAAYGWEIRAREARVLQAGRPPNPVASALAEDYGASLRPSIADAVQPQLSLQLSQLIELGGKRTARQQIAARDLGLARWDYEAARIATLTDVTRAFVDVLAAKRAVGLAEETARLVEDVQASVSARVEAGVVSPIEETKAAVASAAVRTETERARLALASAGTRLSSLVGGARVDTNAVTGDLDTIPEVPALDVLAGRVRQSPDLARWTEEIAQREAVLALERARRTPDVTMTGGYRRFTGIDAHAWMLGASIPLPLFDRNSAAIAEAGHRIAGAREQQRAAALRAGSALTEAYNRLAASRVELSALRTVIIPGAREAFDAVTEGYRLGRFGYLDVLDAQRTLITYNVQYQRTLAEFHKAVADIERLTGSPL